MAAFLDCCSAKKELPLISVSHDQDFETPLSGHDTADEGDDLPEAGILLVTEGSQEATGSGLGQKLCNEHGMDLYCMCTTSFSAELFGR